MSVKHLAGFAVVCGLVVAGLDYYQQAEASEEGLSVQAYVTSVKSRIGVFDESAAADAKSFLPAAPEGWSRRAPSKGDGDHFWGSLGEQNDKAGWVYTNGTDVVWLEAFRNELKTSKGVLGGTAEISAGKIATQPDYLGYAVIGGVGFGETQASAAFRTFDGWVGFGDEIQIRIRAAASDDAVRSILGGIDYDGLNGLLKTPVPTIGAEMRVPSEQEARIAAKIMDLRRAMIGFRADAAIERIQNSNEKIALLNTFVENIAPGAALDVTEGEVPDYEAAIQTTYRNALVLIMESKAPESDVAPAPGKLTCSKNGISTRCRSGG